ncbi:hypothetical protein ACHHV8_33690 [Paenibacillus sp. TAB 01]|uniref:hypothetical protein n=1 Tax=Paenibacillus sp. TAB 01 TaxID=3368988 RepID=UPI0037536C1B
MLLLKDDHIRLHDGRAAEVLDTWGAARCLAKIVFHDGSTEFIISERDVAAILRRPALERKKRGGW